MTTVSRLFAGFAAFALVLAGLSAVAPSSARAQSETFGGPLLAAAIFSAVAIVTFIAIDEDGDDDEEAPQSP